MVPELYPLERADTLRNSISAPASDFSFSRQICSTSFSSAIACRASRATSFGLIIPKSPYWPTRSILRPQQASEATIRENQCLQHLCTQTSDRNPALLSAGQWRNLYRLSWGNA